jgi:DNA mismatch repair protein MutL
MSTPTQDRGKTPTQPGTIAELPPEVVERIAAGEVIERPASVVRELIENALDAGASAIRVELREGGIRLLRVGDDGRGIPADQLALACRPHTTSKVRALADLERIATLGFRGEALASIAAVAELEVTSAADENGLAHTLTLHPDGVSDERATARPRGVSVTVRNLFLSIPARRALLAGPRRESARAAAVVRAYALIHPAVRFTLVMDGRLIFQTPGGTLAEAAAHLYGADLAAALLPIGPLTVAGVEITGAIATRAFSQPAREHVHVAVNGRPIANRALLAAVEAGYRPLLRKGRHPVLVVTLAAPAAVLDVNVHPAKAEVLLRAEPAIAAALREHIHHTLGSAPLAAATAGAPGAVRAPAPIQLSFPAPRVRRGLRLGERRGGYAGRAGDGLGNAPDETPPTTVHPLTALAQFDDALILARSADGHLYLVDQHRASERAIYEALLRERMGAGTALPTSPAVPTPAVTPGQFLLEPMLVELTPPQAELLLPRLAELASLGLDCQPFGGAYFLVRSVPDVPGSAADPGDLARALTVEAAADSDDWLDAVRVALACRAAVRRGVALSPQRQQALLDGLRTVAAPAACPHGSPLLLRYSRAYLRRAFEW